jgi:hypothetical protein
VLGAYPKHPKVLEELMEKKDTNIKALKNKLHILEA